MKQQHGLFVSSIGILNSSNVLILEPLESEVTLNIKIEYYASGTRKNIDVSIFEL